MFLAGHHKAWSDQSFGFAGMRRTGMKTLIILCDNNFYASNAFTTQFLFARRKYQTVLIKIKLYLAECGIEEMRNAELTSTSSPTRFQEESRRFEYHIDLALRSHFLSSICYSHVKSAINSAPRHGAFVWVWGLKRQALAIKIDRNEDVFIGRNSIERQSLIYFRREMLSENSTIGIFPFR